MIEQPLKIYFPSLPFEPRISYFEIKQDNTENTSPELIESSEEEIVNKDCNSSICSIPISSVNNNSSFLNLNSISKNRKRKTTIKMSEEALNFQFSFYQIFTTRKKFPKKFVISIHNEICFNLNVRRVNRDETRSIYLYFVDFADHAEKILLYIKNNKNEIIRRLPELKSILS